MPFRLSTLMTTVTGKAMAGLVVVSTGVGVAAVAGADVSSMPSTNPPGHERELVVGPVSGDDDEGSGPGVAAAVSRSVVLAAPADDDADTDGGEESGSDASHGAVVSEFARSTELVGCEKGQAVAAVARGDLDPASSEFDTDLPAFLERCSQVDDDTADDDTADDDIADDDTADDGSDGEESAGDASHGAVVSEFARSTELVGCEKGQAVAAVARGDLDPASSEFDTDLPAFLEQCSRADDGESSGDGAQPAPEPGVAGSGKPPHADDRGRSEEARDDRGPGNAEGRGNGQERGNGQGRGTGKP